MQVLKKKKKAEKGLFWGRYGKISNTDTAEKKSKFRIVCVKRYLLCKQEKIGNSSMHLLVLSGTA